MPPGSTPDAQLDSALTRIGQLEEEVRSLRLALDVTGSIDQRTGMANRNALIDAIEERRRWLERDDEPFGVMLVIFPNTIDGPHVGALVHAAFREVDRVASWGEWRFGVVLPGLTYAHFDVVAARVRRALQLARIEPDRIVCGAAEKYPADHLLRAMEANADIAPGTHIVEL